MKVKCVVWDLDNTIWNGTLSEGDNLAVNPVVRNVIEELDKRGILQSISSKNNYDDAKEKLEEVGLWEYFIYPQINWNAKSDSVKEIARLINIGIDTLAFVDDQEFELDEVRFSCKDVLCISAKQIDMMLQMEELQPKFVTEDSKMRRSLYQNDIRRNSIEADFTGTKEEFLTTLNMSMTIERAKEDDLKRIEELTVRTHQLNSTGYTYSYEQLRDFITNPDYELLVVQLDDKYGTYGKIGITLVEKRDEIWEIKLLLMSCRVMSKGVGTVLLNSIINHARKANVKLIAQFVPTDRNRIMYISYKFNGFHEVDKKDGVIVFEADLSYERKMPDYVTIEDRGESDGICS